MRKKVLITLPLTVENNSLRPEWQWLVLSLLIGTAYCWYCLGVGFISNFTNTQYINDDMLVHFLGWQLYRNDDWSWPLTMTSRLQYPIETSIVYTDSFPLLSIFLKFISPILPKIFIWHGLVAILSCSLQFYISSRIFRMLRPNNAFFAILGGVFFVFSTALAYRLLKHYALTSHWLILWSLYLILNPKLDKKAPYYNLLIIFLAAGTHAYILIMNLILSIGLLYRHLFFEKQKVLFLIKHTILVLATLGLSAYFFGYFSMVGGVGAFGWGYFSMNLDSWFNPMGFGLLTPNLPLGPRQPEEALQYLGLGIIIALVAAIYNYFQQRVSQTPLLKSSYLGLAISISILFMLSLSTVVMLGSYALFDITNWFDNNSVQNFFSMLRASARFGWPIFYLIMIFALISCYDLLNRRFTHKVALLLMAGLLTIQIIDLIPMRNAIHHNIDKNLERPAWDSDFTSSWWQTLGNYQHLYFFDKIDKDINGYPIYFKLGMLADKYNLKLNRFYLARGTNPYIYQQLNEFANGNIDNQGVYILPAEILQQINPQIQKYCQNLDNYYVCTRNW